MHSKSSPVFDWGALREMWDDGLRDFASPCLVHFDGEAQSNAKVAALQMERVELYKLCFYLSDMFYLCFLKNQFSPSLMVNLGK